MLTGCKRQVWTFRPERLPRWDDDDRDPRCIHFLELLWENQNRVDRPSSLYSVHISQPY